MIKSNDRYRLFILLLLSLLLLATTSATTAAQTAPSAEAFTFEPVPCMFEGLDLGLFTISPEEQGFECGYVTVPEKHAHPDGPTIRLPVAIREATGLDPKPDPLFVAQGGPGGSAFELFSLALPNTPIAAERDIVIFNQRGTVYAKPELVCTELRDDLPYLVSLPPEEGDPQYIDLLNDCYQRLAAEGINLSAYNSVENAADVDAIRRTLGYDEFNFYGVSYGTLLGLHLMRDYPDHLRSVILDSVVPTDLNFILETGQSENRIYNELFQACAQDPACAGAYPNLEERLSALVANLNQNPTTLTLTHPETGETTDAYLNGDLLLDVLFMGFYLSDNYAIFPKIVENLENGDYVFLQEIWTLFMFDTTFSEGMYYSVLCAEDIDFDVTEARLENLRPQIADKVTNELQTYLDSCAVWPVDLLPARVDEPIASDIPTLLLSGRFDPITPPPFADVAAQTLENAYTIVDPLASHGVAFNHPCINQVVQDFLNHPTRQPEAACLESLAPVDVVPPAAITLPILAKVAALDGEFFIQTTVAGLFLLGLLTAFVVWLIVFIVKLIMGKSSNLTPAQKRLRWISRGLVLLFGIFSVIFVGGLVGLVSYALFNGSAYLSAFSVPGIGWPILLIPPLLLVLTLGIVGAAALIWRQRNWAIADKLYYTFLTLCTVGYVSILTYHRFIF